MNDFMIRPAGFFALIVGAGLLFFYRRLDKHYAKHAFKNEYFKIRFFGGSNLVPIGAVLVLMGLGLLLLS